MTNTDKDIDFAKIFFTSHAIKKFIERHPGGSHTFLKVNPDKMARRLLSRSREEGPTVHHVRRIIKHNLEETRYFIIKGWRFVVVKNPGEDYFVKTIERIE